MNEFTYKRGTELYGEKEPADYVYQVKTGRFEVTGCFRMADARSARFISSATSSGWKMEPRSVYGRGHREHQGYQKAQPRARG